MVRVRGSSEGECLGHCDGEQGCELAINWFTYNLCWSCTDVPHESHGGINDYPNGECSAEYGSSDETCKAGCKIGLSQSEITHSSSLKLNLMNKHNENNIEKIQ